ncbi:MAG: hypothetical protein D6823_04900 [Chloroflexi bacterium]|jgi:hypothetical protein|nr:MAG: hypothetical protein D6823_04900 [Chloroflexota bacterium]
MIKFYGYMQPGFLRLRLIPFVVFLYSMVFVAACSSVSPSHKLLVFERSGGLAGFEDRLTVDLETGNVRLQRGETVTTATLSTAQRNRLQTIIAALDGERLATTPVPTSPCCDRLNYLIQIDTVVIRFTDVNAPTECRPLLEVLNTIIADITSHRSLPSS